MVAVVQSIDLVGVAIHLHCFLMAVGSFLMAVEYTNSMVVSQIHLSWTVAVGHYLEAHIDWMGVRSHLDFHLDCWIVGVVNIVDLGPRRVLLDHKQNIDKNGKYLSAK